MVYSLILWTLAAICNSACDTLSHHYYSSVFCRKGWSAKFWNPILSSTEAYVIPYTKYKLDAWHLFKSSMIILLALSITFAWMYGPPLLNVWWYYVGLFILLGIVWNGVFNLFYNHILR